MKEGLLLLWALGGRKYGDSGRGMGPDSRAVGDPSSRHKASGVGVIGLS